MTTGPVLDVAWIVDGPGGAKILKGDQSQQLPEDPFAYSKESGESGLVRPPYDLDQLVSSLESNALHARCVTQKASDVLGRGIVLRAKESDVEAPAEGEDRWGAFVDTIEDDDRGDGSLKERLTWAHQDYESVGQSVLEISRDAQGNLDGMWHVPAHTVRVHADGRRYAQKRGGKATWFKRYGIDGDVDRKEGGWTNGSLDHDRRGNELIFIRNYSPRSDYYGLPDHIPALAAMAGWRSQAMFNVRFFDNYAVPAVAVVVEGATLSPGLEATILEHFQKIKGDPSRTIIIPIPGGSGDEASQPKLRFEKLSSDIKDASFRGYKQDNALEICIAHGMPPYRVGWPITGSLGGSTAEEMTAIYNDAIVQQRQETWEQRLNRALLGPKGLDISDWTLKCAELDMRNEIRDLAKAKELYLMGATTPDKNAAYFGFDGRPEGVPGGDLYIPVPYAPGGHAEGASAGAAPVLTDAIAKRWVDELVEIGRIKKRVEEIMASTRPQLVTA